MIFLPLFSFPTESQIVLFFLVKTFQPFLERRALLGLFTDLHLVHGQQTQGTNLRLVEEVGRLFLCLCFLLHLPREKVM